MADEGTSLSSPSSTESPPDSSPCRQDCVSRVAEDLFEGYGPSSIEVQLDLSNSSRSVSLESRLDDFNDCNSPLNTVASDVEQDLDIMGIANTWNEDDAFVSAAAPAENLDTSFLVLPRTSYGPRPSPPPLDMFSEDQEPDCEPVSDVKDINSCAGVCGLRNLGNTCFMNSGLQCLVSTAPLVNYFIVHAVDEQPLEDGGSSSLTFHFAILLRKMWSGHYSTLSPADFKQALSLCHSQFKDYRQHDCQEFLALMLDTLHEQLKVLQLKPSTDQLNPSTVREDRAADTAPECCLHAVSGEAVELYESSRSSQLSSPRSSDSAETSSSCTTSYSSAAAAAALSIRSLPIPEDVREFAADYGPACASLGGLQDAFVFPAAEKIQTQQMILRRNNLDSSHDNRMDASPVFEKNILTEISSMIKDSKTANVNLMNASTSDVPANNELYFDSYKFPRVEHLKSRPGHPVSPTVLRNSLDKVDKSVPIKVTNCLREAAKRNSDVEDSPCASSQSLHSSKEFSSKKARLEDWCLLGSSSTPPGKSSVVTELFQGLFRSTVVCSSCNHVSVTNEPFVYLSLPLPHALERTLEVVVVPATKSVAPYTISVLVNQYDKVGKLRQAIERQLNWQPDSKEDLVLAEVTDHYVARVLEDHALIRGLKETQRSVYAFLVPNSQDLPTVEDADQESRNVADEQGQKPWKSCVICLDEKSDDDLFKHTSCPCLLCQSCIELSCRHQGGDGQSLLCPVCYVQVRHQDEFAPLAKIHEYKPVLRNLRIAIVFRVEQQPQQQGEGKNAPTLRLTGCPRMVQLPSVVHGSTVYKILQDVVPETVDFRVHLVDSEGLRCSRCLYPSRCTGCLVSKDQQLSLQPGDFLAVQPLVSEDSSPAVGCFDACPVPNQESPGEKKVQRCDVLTLSDCLRAFSESELLDEGNPWFCPSCQKNQCASKTLSVQQPPPFIIIYLKRFVFHENASIKLDNRVAFPVDGLDLAPYISSSVDTGGAVYNLYAAVCHFGSASSGHYTCYSKHSSTGEWHYYNDETVLKRSPQEDDYRHAYILFYQRVSSLGAQSTK